MKKQIFRIPTLTIFTIYFPLIAIFINIFFYLFGNLSRKEKLLIFINITYIMTFIDFIYFRVNDTGDVYRYALSLNNYKQMLLNGTRDSIIMGIYESFYPGWYFLLYITSKFNLSIQYINALAGFTIYSSFFYLIYKLEQKYNSNDIDKYLFIKVFLFLSFVSIFSGYKTIWAFSLVAVGLYMLINEKSFGYIFLLLGLSLHAVAFFPIFIYFISKIINFKDIYLYISLIIGLIAKNIIFIFNSYISIPFIGSKINTYIYGEWANYRFQDNGEYVKVFLSITIVLFILSIIIFKFIEFNSVYDKFFKRYNNFILWYFSIALWFVSFRTIETRLISDGIIFFIPLFYQLFLYQKVYFRNSFIILFLIWLLIIDFRLFNIFNDSYILGWGFPENLIESPITILFKGTL